MKEYKILTQRMSAFQGKPFTPQTLEDALNIMAKEGFRVVQVITTNFWSNRSDTFEPIVFLERECPSQSSNDK